MKVRGPQPYMPKKGKKAVDALPNKGGPEQATGFKHQKLTGRNQNSTQYGKKGAR